VSIEQTVPGFESWWDVPVAEVSAQADVVAARSGYLEQRKKQRVFV
jgi:3D-(3,5/4)-trihydroxycyclohexane-1,2-dione acylhydrolase (decyclizing)